MQRHTIDPVSAVFGAAAILLGVLVIGGHADTLVDNPVWLIAFIAIAIGVMLLELAFRRWHRRPRV